jgi:hypothetical protein
MKNLPDRNITPGQVRRKAGTGLSAKQRLGNMFVVVLMTTAMSINFSLAKMFNPYVGWGSAGFFLGGTLGAVTRLRLVKSINWERFHE